MTEHHHKSTSRTETCEPGEVAGGDFMFIEVKEGEVMKPLLVTVDLGVPGSAPVFWSFRRLIGFDGQQSEEVGYCSTSLPVMRILLASWLPYWLLR